MVPIHRLASLSRTDRDRVLRRSRATVQDCLPQVAEILAKVRKNGDAALRSFTQKYDHVKLSCLWTTGEEIEAGASRISSAVKRALSTAARNIREFHAKTAPSEIRLEAPFNPTGSFLGRKLVPLDRVGLYVPGGTAAYPSSVLMTGIPAKVAGVPEVVLCTPPRPDGSLAPEVLAACQIAGVDRIFKLGGAQAIAAMAYGTESVPRVDKLVGPGNAYVTAAKQLVRDDVAIDLPAGPSELLVLSDGTGRADYMAADLLSQAEHDPAASVVLVTTRAGQANQVAELMETMLKRLPRRDIIRKVLDSNAIALLANSLDEGIDFANEYAAEHLSLQVQDPRAALKRIRHAGSIFLGPLSAVAFGDYCSGPNHVLPTGGEARRYSGLGVSDFLRSISYQFIARGGLERLAPTAVALARAEGFEAHAQAVELRLRIPEQV
ncbi:MAG: histidinol dehydrogenase [Planctomycetes bacterium]|nr:histidinol dehydrogenase [Planctomycetota bacterium]